MSSTERRHPRFEFHDLPWVFSVQWPEPATQERPVRVEARNISRGGFKFSSNHRVPLFSELEIVLLDKKDGREVATLTGKVVRLEEVDIGVGERTYGIALELTSGADALHPLLPDLATGTNGSGT